MNRREALKLSLAGGALLTSSGVWAACARGDRSAEPTAGVLTPADQLLWEDIADTLLPATPSSPGAKAAGVGATINLLLSDCYKPEEQRRAVNGLADFRAAVRAKHGTSFSTLDRARREQILQDADAEARKADEAHYFQLVRELSNLAYFTSQIGMTKALRYIPVPGHFTGCVPLEPGQPAWG